MLIHKNRLLIFLIPLLLILLWIHPNSSGQGISINSDIQETVNIYLFWGDGCPNCILAKPGLERIADRNANVNLYSFEVYHNADNLALFHKFSEIYRTGTISVPTIFISNLSWVGYSVIIHNEIDTFITNCLTSTCIDLGKTLINQETSTSIELPHITAFEQEKVEIGSKAQNSNEFKIPFIGTIDLKHQSLLVSTLAISFVDGINPCSMWLLLILFSFSLQALSHKKALMVGCAFLIVTSTIYGLFISGLINVLHIIPNIGLIQFLISFVALGVALINIMAYFLYQENLSQSANDENKSAIYKPIHSILTFFSQSTFPFVVAAITLAIGVATIDLTCTSGFSIIWRNLLDKQGVNTLTYLLLLFAYLFIYHIIELSIFFLAVFILRTEKVKNIYSRVLNLAGGMLMLTLAIVILIDPSIMNNAIGSLTVFGTALALTGLIFLIHQVL